MLSQLNWLPSVASVSRVRAARMRFALARAQEQQHLHASSKLVERLCTSGKMGRSCVDPGFPGVIMPTRLGQGSSQEL